VRRFALAAAFCAALGARAQPRPAFIALPGGVAAIALPASMLDESAIRKQLNSGLTTVFLMIARERGTRNAGGARIEIRYDLWDEVWIVRKIELDRKVDEKMARKVEQQRLANFDALVKWWRNPARIFVSGAGRVLLDVEMRVLPFSAAEEKDAREWISKSGGVAAAGGGGGGGIVDALIGTTITARPITTYRWSAELMLK